MSCSPCSTRSRSAPTLNECVIKITFTGGAGFIGSAVICHIVVNASFSVPTALSV